MQRILYMKIFIHEIFTQQLQCNLSDYKIFLRLVPISGGVSAKDFDCHLSFWNPDANLKQLLREGACLRIYSVTAARSK